MAIAPIKGILRKKLYTDIVVSFALGTAGAYAYWYGIHVPYAKKRDAYYSKLQLENK